MRDGAGKSLRSPSERHLEWDGCFNARDLGGLPAAETVTRRGVLVRSDSLDDLSPSGWQALWHHGVRTIIDLRNEDERGKDRSPRPDGLTTLHLPLDASEDRDFWSVWASGPQFGTPLYYGPHLKRFPERTVAVVRAIAHAEPGGVLYHCGSGRDRVGQVSVLILRMLGVLAPVIAEDYELSALRLRERYRHLGQPDQGPEIAAFLCKRGETTRAPIEELVSDQQLMPRLCRAGLQDDDVRALKTRALV